MTQGEKCLEFLKICLLLTIVGVTWITWCECRRPGWQQIFFGEVKVPPWWLLVGFPCTSPDALPFIKLQACTRRQMWWHRPKITYWPGHHMTWSERRGEWKNPTLYRTPVVLRLHSLTIYLPDNHPLSLSAHVFGQSLSLSLWSFRLGFVFLNNIRFFLCLGYFL